MAYKSPAARPTIPKPQRSIDLRPASAWIQTLKVTSIESTILNGHAKLPLDVYLIGSGPEYSVGSSYTHDHFSHILKNIFCGKDDGHFQRLSHSRDAPTALYHILFRIGAV